jgi:hypothetical protein
MVEEIGVTNLGPVPNGMSFLDATVAMRQQRKYTINPNCQSRRLTVCETMREIYRAAENIPEPHKQIIQELAAAGFDYGKRMNQRMVDLKAALSA